MAWAPDYVTEDELKSYLRIPTDDEADDAEIGFAITAASRAVDAACNRQFGESAMAETRTYTVWYHRPSRRFRLTTDDLSDVDAVTVTVDDVEYDETEVEFWPPNAALNGQPYTAIVFPESAGPNVGVAATVEATFGWSAVPAAVQQATLIQAARFFLRRNAPFGIAGSPEAGSEMRLLAKVDPDVAVVLGPYMRHWMVK